MSLLFVHIKLLWALQASSPENPFSNGSKSSSSTFFLHWKLELFIALFLDHSFRRIPH
jgi:hypothetical protein